MGRSTDIGGGSLFNPPGVFINPVPFKFSNIKRLHISFNLELLNSRLKCRNSRIVVLGLDKK